MSSIWLRDEEFSRTSHLPGQSRAATLSVVTSERMRAEERARGDQAPRQRVPVTMNKGRRPCSLPHWMARCGAGCGHGRDRETAPMAA